MVCKFPIFGDSGVWRRLIVISNIQRIIRNLQVIDPALASLRNIDRFLVVFYNFYLRYVFIGIISKIEISPENCEKGVLPIYFFDPL